MMDTNIVLAAAQPGALDVLTQVDAFYNTAWQHLLIFSTVMLTVVGIVFPIIIQIIQSRSLKREESALNDKIDRLVEQGRSTLQQAMRSDLEAHKKELSLLVSQYDDKLKAARDEIQKLQEENQAKLRKELEKQISRASGSIYHVQGLFLKNDKSYESAALSMLTAADYQLAADDQLNLRRCLKLITEDCLPQLDKRMMQKNPRIRTDATALINKLSNNDDNGQFQDVTESLRKAVEEAGERELKPAQPPPA